ncbi:helix-turn-helix domain-containing protein [Rhodobacter sp. SY28-1]|uniref:helix-turn-helix domain-containing protein n=1 Tax=Rhodobacter sp. SY28-1 TaxID=2562317 RepID=UPI0010C02C74|nr:helix-turn-helix domain-containing protein [Rhodobacter sp. SY28-1]
MDGGRSTAQRRRNPMPVPNHDRHFYSRNRAFGRFGIRIFEPELMALPHWHGHVELNFAMNFRMDYDFDGTSLTVPEGRLVLFWAGVPHQLTGIDPVGEGAQRLANIYLPLDSFLQMRHIMPLQAALIGRGMAVLPPSLCDSDLVQRWYMDYRSGDFERAEIVKMELNALFRRAAITGVDFLRPPQHEIGTDRSLSSAHVRHIIAMVRYVLENLDKPLLNAQVTAVTGLHENYALSLFSKTMQVPLKQFINRMRLMRARALLVESSTAISAVAEQSGFSSITQFYAQFRAGYGISPAALRQHYIQMDLR